MKFQIALPLVLVTLFLSGAASAMSIDAPSLVPENASWGFSVSLDPTDTWTSTSVKLAGNNLLTVNPNGSVLLDPINGRYVIRTTLIDEDPKSTAGLVLYVSVSGFGNGTYSIVATDDSNSVSKSVAVYVPLDQSYKPGFDSQLGSVQADVNSMEATYGANISSLQNDVNDNWGKLSGLEDRVSALSQKLGDEEAMQARISSLESKVSQLEEQDNKLALASQKASSESPLAALVGLAVGLFWPFAFILGFLVVVALILVAKSRLDKASVYSNLDEHNLPVSKEQEEIADALHGGSKWAKK